jgi:hypothetical protein
MVFVGLLMFAFLYGVPIYWVGLFFFYRKKPRPGIIFWLVNPAVAVIWAGFVLIILGQQLKTHSAGQAASATTTASTAPAPINGGSVSGEGATIDNLHFPKPWGVASDGHTWLAASELDKQTLAGALSAASSQQHTAFFFYTNLNEQYSSEQKLVVSIYMIFNFLDYISPTKSYPTFQGFLWQRMDAKQTPQGLVEVIGAFWPDGHSFIHYQKTQSNILDDIGADGPWDGDLVTYTCTTTLSGDNFTIQTTAPVATTETGTFQVSADGEELDMAHPFHIPIRYKNLLRLGQ